MASEIKVEMKELHRYIEALGAHTILPAPMTAEHYFTCAVAALWLANTLLKPELCEEDSAEPFEWREAKLHQQAVNLAAIAAEFLNRVIPDWMRNPNDYYRAVSLSCHIPEEHIPDFEPIGE
ncbi:MAG: hypothetical protein IT428_06730 [Planctomycetaceae bacterium]|nr:hypothetical protein [Planctomycetaceae bacterium]